MSNDSPCGGFDLRFVLNSIPGFAAVLLPDGTIETVNGRIMEYTGQALEELKRWATNGTVHPDDYSLALEHFRHSMATGEPYDFEMRLRRFDGQYRWFRHCAARVLSLDGRDVRWCVLLTDIHERKSAEEALDEKRSELARVSRATSFAAATASIVHEVNQPLTAAIINANACRLLLDANPPNVDDARETIRETIRDGNRASEILAKMANLFSGKRTAMAAVDLNAAAKDVIALCKKELQRNRTSLSTDFLDTLPLVHGDRVQLQQVMLNLILNASDAMKNVDDRPRHIDVETAAEHEGARFTVRDTGVGVAPASQAHVFDAFYTTKDEGMGIGLSVSRSIIDHHGGRLWIVQREGPGAAFSFVVPWDTDEPRGDAGPSAGAQR